MASLGAVRMMATIVAAGGLHREERDRPIKIRRRCKAEEGAEGKGREFHPKARPTTTYTAHSVQRR